MLDAQQPGETCVKRHSLAPLFWILHVVRLSRPHPAARITKMIPPTVTATPAMRVSRPARVSGKSRLSPSVTGGWLAIRGETTVTDPCQALRTSRKLSTRCLFRPQRTTALHDDQISLHSRRRARVVTNARAIAVSMMYPPDARGNRVHQKTSAYVSRAAIWKFLRLPSEVPKGSFIVLPNRQSNASRAVAHGPGARSRCAHKS